MVQPKYHGDLCWCHFSINLNFPGDWRISGMSTVEIWWRPFLNSFWKSPACSFWMLVFREFFGVEIYHWYISLLQAIFKKNNLMIVYPKLCLCCSSDSCFCCYLMLFQNNSPIFSQNLPPSPSSPSFQAQPWGGSLRQIGWGKLFPSQLGCVNVPRRRLEPPNHFRTHPWHKSTQGRRCCFVGFSLDGWKNCWYVSIRVATE